MEGRMAECTNKLAVILLKPAAGVVIERGAQHDMTPSPDGMLPTMASPDDIFVVTAGGAGGGWSAYLPSWAPVIHSRAATRRVGDHGSRETPVTP